MTIRQQGGIFGRNPTFNDVDVEGTLTVAGSPISPGGTMAAQDANAVAIIGGTINGTTVGASTASTGAFTTLGATGTATLATVDINAGNIDGTAIGAAAKSSGAFTTLSANNATTITNLASDYYGTSFQINNTNPDFSGAIIDIRATAGSINTTNGKYLRGYRDNGINETFYIKASGQIYTEDNLVIGTSGKGIDFSATAGTGTSELFSDYEEGSWSPSVGGDATYHVQDGYYVKAGSLVYVQGKIQVNVIGTGSTTTVSGLPFTAMNAAQASSGTGSCAYFGSLATSVTTLTPYVNNAAATIIFGSLGAAGTAMTGVTTVFQNSARIDFSLTYRAV